MAGTFDWSWIDGPLEHMQATGMQPILDPLHHVSFPSWLQDGFANPAFPDFYMRFIQEVAKRYPWVDRYTIVNEPLPTTVLCALTGDWYPHQTSEREFVTMAKNVARALCLAAREVRKLNPAVLLYHIDSCEHHVALDSQTESWVAHANRRRFLFHDLTLGYIDENHPLLPYLRQHGFSEDERHWFQDHASPIDVLGLDYYAHSEIEWRWNRASEGPAIDFPCKNPQGFAATAQQYVERFKLPVMLSETNVGGSVTDRVTWLKYMEQESEQLSARADFRGFCWFPSLDATDWDTLCTVANKRVSPMGIWTLNQDSGAREDSELSDWYVRLARGECSSRDLPAYRLNPPLDEHLKGFVQRMKGDVIWHNPTIDTLVLAGF